MNPTTESPASAVPAKFPGVFWSANTIELFERGAYYAMASFVVLYLGQMGLGSYWPSTLNGFLWTLVYFLPILSGTIADHVGFRASLLTAFVMLGAGYFLMGYPVWFGGAQLLPQVSEQVTAGPGVVVPLLFGILLIGLGGSIVKPCISGTVQKTAGARATLAFAIFYMVVNIGSLLGRGIAYVVRTSFDLSFIFAVAVGSAIVAFVLVALLYRDPVAVMPAVARPRRSIGRILLDMVLVVKNVRFALFLVVSSGFWFLYSQVYNVLPLYLKHVVELEPAVDLYTMANPITIVLFQLLVTKLFGRMRPIRSIVVGALIISAAMLLNIVPAIVGGVREPVAGLIPLGAVMVILTVAMIAFGELFTSARTYEYIGALAPKGQEGLFLGYANLPMAIGSLIGGPVGAALFHEVICHDARTLDNGLLALDPFWSSVGWMLLVVIGLITALGLWLYNRWLERLEAAEG